MRETDNTLLMKHALGLPAIERIAASVTMVVPDFNGRAFQQDAQRGLAELELKARVKHLINVLHQHFNMPFNKVSRYLQLLPAVWKVGAEGDSKASFAAWPLIDYVAVYGLDHPIEALQTLEVLTPLFTAEFAIRPFIQQHTDVTYAKLLEWCAHPSEHVRRLASEGSRTRLPWGMRLPQFIIDPAPLLAILGQLQADESLYVRRSVANNLNDISKDNPEWMIDVCRQWLANGRIETQWIVKHALRSLIKAGDSRALSLLGYSENSTAVTSDLHLQKRVITVGDTLHFSCTITAGECAQKLVVDYRLYFMKANGQRTAKVFKLKNIVLAANETIILHKKHSFKPITTRRYYAGEHELALQINGREVARSEFSLIFVPAC